MTSRAGNCTPSATSQLSSHATTTSPTATQTVATDPSDQVAKIVGNPDVEKTPEQPLHRQISLIPAYNYQDTIADLDLDNLLGTPYTCELKAKKKRDKKKRNKASKIANNIEKKIEDDEEEEFFTPISITATAAAAETLSEKKEVPALPVKEHEEDDSTDITAIMQAMSLGKPKDPTNTTFPSTTTSKDTLENNTIDVSVKPAALLRGLPEPTGTHIRFDDSPVHRTCLLGVPQPTGTHTTFEDE
jgi:hypothetical protein